MAKPSFTKKLFLQELKNNFGVIQDACEAVSMGTTTYQRWMEEDVEFAKKVNEIIGTQVLFVEGKLFKKVKEENLDGIKFYLKCKGKSRGWVEGDNIIIQQNNVNQTVDLKEFESILKKIENG